MVSRHIYLFLLMVVTLMAASPFCYAVENGVNRLWGSDNLVENASSSTESHSDGEPCWFANAHIINYAPRLADVLPTPILPAIIAYIVIALMVFHCTGQQLRLSADTAGPSPPLSLAQLSVFRI